MSGEPSVFWQALVNAVSTDFELSRHLFSQQLEGSYEMPYRQQKFISVASHDAENWEVFVVYGHDRHRYSVLVPKNLQKAAVYQAAVGLAVYVRLLTGSTDIFVRRDHVNNGIRSATYRAEADNRAAEQRRIAAEEAALSAVERAARERVRAAEQAARDALRPAYERREPMTPTAKATAKELLRQIDPILFEKMERGVAFYFCTNAHAYIWHPGQRAIVSLDEDMPKYVCVHSKDNAVEQNPYDWALTMRTYLLGAETHWRSKANFHQEYGLRGGVTGFAQKTVDITDNKKES